MNRKILVLFIALLPVLVFAQPDTLWTAVYGEDQFNQVRDIEFDSQGNIWMTGTKNWTQQDQPTDPTIDGHMWLLKMSPDGEVLLDREFSYHVGNQGMALVPAHDGGHVIVGISYDDTLNTSGDVYVVHADADGELVWEVSIGSDLQDKGRDIVATQDGGYVIVGWTRSGDEGMDDAYVIKIDADGNVLWEQTFGGPQNDQLWSIIALDNGHFVSAGRTWSFGAGGRDALIVELDADGNVVWLNTVGGPEKDHIYEISLAHDGGFIGTGKTESFDMGNGDAWLIKLDTEGNEEWISIWGNDRGEFGRSCVATTDGNYVFCGETNAGQGVGNQVLLAKADPLGNWMWSSEVGGQGMDDSWSVRQAAEGDYIVAGNTQAFGNALQSIYVIRYQVEYDPIDLDVWSIDEPIYVSQGGIFSRSWRVHNNQVVTTDTLDLWQQIAGPDSMHTLEILFDNMIVLEPQTSISATNELTVGDWSDGEFWLHMFVGDYPDVYSTDSLLFHVSSTGWIDPWQKWTPRPDKFSLTHVYPNPFNSETNITLTLPYQARVELCISDVMGREVVTVLSASLAAGEHSFPIRLDNLASGMYFLTATADHGWRDTRRITLLK